MAAEERSAAKFLATRSAAAPVRHLLFQRPDQASRQWMVEWGKSLARLNSPSVRYGSERGADPRQIFFYTAWFGNMPAGDQLSHFYLAAPHPANLARRCHRHAWRDCCVDGLYLFGLIMAVLNVAAFGIDLFRLHGKKVIDYSRRLKRCEVKFARVR